MDPTPQELVQRAVSGDEDALSKLLLTHGPPVRAQIESAIAPKWRNILDADDVMQVTYLEAFLRIDRFQNRGDGAFPAWLAHIARNNLRDAIEALSRLKRPQPEDRISPNTEDSAVRLVEQLGCTTTTPSRHAGKREIQQAVEAAVARLPDDYATVVRMYDLEGKPAAQVAASLNRTEGAIYMLRARAHDRLRENLASASSL